MRHVLLCLAFSAASFLCLTGSDALAVRYAGRRLSYGRIALASFTSISIGHTLGFAVLSSSALRYRFYTAWGLTQGDVGRVLLSCGITVTLGILTTAGVASLARPALAAGIVGVPRSSLIAAAAACLLVVAAYLGFAALRVRTLRIRRFELPAPGLGLALGQVAVGTADQFAVSAALYHVLAASSDIGYLTVAAAYAAANGAAVVTHVPGGLGVIETVFVVLLPGAQVIGALIAFRAIYYLLPFVLGCLVLAAAEVHRRRHGVGTPATAE
jgi:hypothetical protein